MITFVTKAKSIESNDDSYLYLETFNAGDRITIDWGDGSKEVYVSVREVEDDEVWYEIEPEYTYAGNSSHTVTIKGKIKGFEIGNCKVTSIDVTKCPALEFFGCSDNQLTSLDVSKNTALRRLSCSNNQLTSLDVSGCTALEGLGCSNQLTSLDVSKNTALEWLWCGDNQFSASALNQIFNDLPQGKSWIDEDGYKEQSTISMLPNPGSQTCNRSIAENKGWWFYHN